MSSGYLKRNIKVIVCLDKYDYQHIDDVRKSELKAEH